ncbi:MAG: sel1 repeat family protein [Ectothiorhodospiraceae bacterium]|nr:sel1 repeat family protein [Ectothiorhodospiraceae bacterium]
MRFFLGCFVVLLSLNLQAETSSLLLISAKEGDPRSQYDLAIRYLKGDGIEKNVENAIKWLEKSVGQDYSHAQLKLGMLYQEGDKVEKDMDVAVEYLTMAAEQGNATAQYLLGNIYLQGDGVEQDYDEAEEWLELAAGHDYKKAILALDALLTLGEENSGKNTSTLEVKAKTDNNKTAIVIPENITAKTAHEIGMNYLRGIGVSRDYKIAIIWLSKGAELGNVDSQYQYGELLRKGRGTKKNKKQADKWFRAAAKQGHIKAKNRLDGCGFC